MQFHHFSKVLMMFCFLALASSRRAVAAEDDALDVEVRVDVPTSAVPGTFAMPRLINTLVSMPVKSAGLRASTEVPPTHSGRGKRPRLYA